MDRRLVITGLGAVTSIGLDVQSTWEGLLAGKNGVGPITRFDASSYDVRIAAEVKDFDIELYMDKREARRLDMFVQYAIAAAQQAVDQSGLDFSQLPPDRTGVIVGSGVGGTYTWEDQHAILLEKGPRRVSPFFIPMMIIDMAAGMIAMRWGLEGPNYSTVSACASGTSAFIAAAAHIERGEADVMIVGGGEAAVSPLCVAGFDSLKALSTRNDAPEKASRPLDAERDGFVIGEGAGILVLEELEHAKARGAELLAELVGFGASGDAYHMTAPHPEGRGAILAMRSALKLAKANLEDVGYINAHGTSTEYNDKVETLAIKTLFGDYARKIAINSSKSMLGHMLGAGGPVEAIATILQLRHGILHQTANYEAPDPECDLDYVPEGPRETNAKLALCNSFGFGGHNAVLALAKYEG